MVILCIGALPCRALLCAVVQIHWLSFHLDSLSQVVGCVKADGQIFRSIVVDETTHVTIVFIHPDLSDVASGRLGLDEVLK